MVRSLSRRSTPEKNEGSVLGYSETLNVLHTRPFEEEEIARLRTRLRKFERVLRATMSLETAKSRYSR